MATGRDTKLTGATGEYLVAAELCRRGLFVTRFAELAGDDLPRYGMMASDAGGRELAVQVNTLRRGSWQFHVQKFLEVRFAGGRQHPGSAKREPHPRLACVLVA